MSVYERPCINGKEEAYNGNFTVKEWHFLLMPNLLLYNERILRIKDLECSLDTKQLSPIYCYIQSYMSRATKWVKEKESLDFNWHFNKWNTALPIYLPELPSFPFPCSLSTAAETIIEIGTFRPCMFRIPGVLPAETVIDSIVEHITGPFTNVLKRNQFFKKKKIKWKEWVLWN